MRELSVQEARSAEDRARRRGGGAACASQVRSRAQDARTWTGVPRRPGAWTSKSFRDELRVRNMVETMVEGGNGEGPRRPSPRRRPALYYANNREPLRVGGPAAALRGGARAHPAAGGGLQAAGGAERAPRRASARRPGSRSSSEPRRSAGRPSRPSSTSAWPACTASSRPGGAGAPTSPSAPGAPCARTTAPTATPGTTFPHDQARSKAYRWGEDGLAGICDRYQLLVLRPRLLERARSRSSRSASSASCPREGNHGEDVKEYYFYLDATPTHSYMKWLYKYPQREYPVRAARRGEPAARRRAARSSSCSTPASSTTTATSTSSSSTRKADARGPRDPRHRRTTAAPSRRRCTCCRTSGSATPGPGAREPRPRAA